MIVHRIAALVLSAAMLHLSVTRADVACAAHGGMQANVSQPMPGMHHDAPAPERCTAPSQQGCCEAMASCAVVLFGSDIVRVMDQTPARETAVLLASIAPASRVAAPDPPPPRQ